MERSSSWIVHKSNAKRFAVEIRYTSFHSWLRYAHAVCRRIWFSVFEPSFPIWQECPSNQSSSRTPGTPRGHDGCVVANRHWRLRSQSDVSTAQQRLGET